MFGDRPLLSGRSYAMSPSALEVTSTDVVRVHSLESRDPGPARLPRLCTTRSMTAALRPLHEADVHLFRSLRVPVNVSVSQFDDQIVRLAKVTVGALDEKPIVAATAGSEAVDGGINKLERLLAQEGGQDPSSTDGQPVSEAGRCRYRGRPARHRSRPRAPHAPHGHPPGMFATVHRRRFKADLTAGPPQTTTPRRAQYEGLSCRDSRGRRPARGRRPWRTAL